MGIIELLKNLSGIAFAWITGYSSKDNKNARVESDANKKKDDFNKELKDGDIDAVRRDLS